MIRTDRLLLRPWRQTDLPALAAINADPRVMRYFPAVQTEAETQAFLGRCHRHQETHGYCYFAAETRADGRLIGFIGLAYQTYAAPFTPATDIGWRLHPDAWGKGYATEGALACLAFAWESLRLPEVVAVAVRQNAPSIRVMERIGMRYRDTFLHPALAEHPEIQPCVVYAARNPGK